MRTRIFYQRGFFQPLGAILLSASLLAGCSADGPDTLVEVCGNLSVPDEVDSLRVVITDQDGQILREGVRELWTCPGPSLMQLPQHLEFSPVDGDVFVRIQGLRGGVPVIENTLRKTLGPDAHRATISLEQGCLGIQCAPGATCSQGACELIALASDTISACAGLSTHAEDPDAGDEPDNDTSGSDLCPPSDPGTPDDPDAAHEQDESALNFHGAGASEGL